jgi:hypothetical protein
MILEAIPANEKDSQSTRAVVDEALAKALQAEGKDEALFMPQVEKDTQEGSRRSGRARKHT